MTPFQATGGTKTAGSSDATKQCWCRTSFARSGYNWRRPAVGSIVPRWWPRRNWAEILDWPVVLPQQPAVGRAAQGHLHRVYGDAGPAKSASQGCRLTCSFDADPGQLVDDILGELGSRSLDDEVAFVEGAPPRAVCRRTSVVEFAALRHSPGRNLGRHRRNARHHCRLCLDRVPLRTESTFAGCIASPQIDPAWRQLDAAGLEKLKASVMIEARKAGQPAAGAWDRLRKDLEIDRSLRRFSDAGVSATYHACDVSDRQELVVMLERVREIDGPIEGVLHGAGIDRSCRFDRKIC